MYFVPEGQHDSSQVRSAWMAIQKHPRPGGTVEVIVSPLSVPEIFIVETELMPLSLSSGFNIGTRSLVLKIQ
jgi:hypothetical protein